MTSPHCPICFERIDSPCKGTLTGTVLAMEYKHVTGEPPVLLSEEEAEEKRSMLGYSRQ